MGRDCNWDCRRGRQDERWPIVNQWIISSCETTVTDRAGINPPRFYAVHTERSIAYTPIKRRYISADRVIISPVETVMELSLNVANRQDHGGTFVGLIDRDGRPEVRNSPNHRGIHLPRQGEILVRVPRAERVQPRPGGVAVLPVLVYRQVPRRAGSC